MGTRFKPVAIPLAGSLNQNQTVEAGDLVTYKRLENLWFDKKDTLRSRPAQQNTNGLTTRTLNAAGQPEDFGVTLANSSLQHVPQWMFNFQNGLGQRPAVQMYGHTFVYEQGKWVDRLGAVTARTRRLADYREIAGTAPADGIAVADNFGYAAVSTESAALLAADGSIKMYAKTNSGIVLGIGIGTSARCGQVVATVNWATGTNDLYYTARVGDQLSVAVNIAANAKAVTGRGDAPVIFCDQDASVFYLTYYTTGGAREICVKRITPTTGAVLTTTTFNIGGAATSSCLWGCNTSVADNKLILAVTDTAGLLQSIVLNATTLANSGVDVVLDASGGNVFRQVVCGAAFNNKAYIVAKQNTSGELRMYTRTYNTASFLFVYTFFGADYGTAPGVDANGVEFNILHQPVLVGPTSGLTSRRVVLGISTIHGVAINSGTHWPSTWYQVDVTDIYAPGTGGTKKIGTLLARGPLMQNPPAWQPFQATLIDWSSGLGSNTIRFGTVEFRQFRAGNLNSAVGTLGSEPTIGIHETVLSGMTADASQDGTVIAGAIPHYISRGYSSELGFPYLDSPPITVTKTAVASTLLANTYTWAACWRWIDETGQEHNSAPSALYTITIANGDKMTITGPTLQLTEREYGKIWLDIFYVTNGATGATLFRYTSLDATTTGVAPGTVTVDFSVLPTTAPSVPLYTAGGVLPNRWVGASGGVATFNRRTWLSDGKDVYASKLLGIAKGPAWNNDGPLTLRVPSSAGMVQGLQVTDGKLVVGCEHGIYATTGDGPDDTGIGQDFIEPQKVSSLGVNNPQAFVACGSRGVVFQSSGDSNLGAGHSLWLLDRGFTATKIGEPVESDTASATALALVYWPEAEHLVVRQSGSTNTFWLFDMASGKWTKWIPSTNGCRAFTVSDGQLFCFGIEGSMFQDEEADIDNAADDEAIAWTFETQDLPSNLKDPLTWNRVKSIRFWGQAVTNPVTITATFDGNRAYSGVWAPLQGDNATNPNVWPADNYSPEFRIGSQKCTSVRVKAQGTGRVGLTHLKMMIAPVGGNSPAFSRR